ncbi:undecaprenyl-diphosphatase, partial [Bacillus vallismortis]|nr:undecaprenyl-diphosphatase [Bacillus vallismortis]
ADFRFIMEMTILMGASFLSLVKHWDILSSDLMPFFIVGFIFAFVVALFVVRFFLKLINKVKLVPFAIYRIIIGVILLLIMM